MSVINTVCSANANNEHNTDKRLDNNYAPSHEEVLQFIPLGGPYLVSRSQRHSITFYQFDYLDTRYAKRAFHGFAFTRPFYFSGREQGWSKGI